MNFVPNEPDPKTVPFYDDVTSDDGWRGHRTGKSLDTLQSEISQSTVRLGGVITGFQQGTFQDEKPRLGMRIFYVYSTSPGRVDLAALPVRETSRNRSTVKARREQSLRMTLYMFREALDGFWLLEWITPGYISLLPWLIADGQQTFTQLWSASTTFAHLLPPGGAEWVEGEWQDV